MTSNQANLGGTQMIAPQDGKVPGRGPELTVWEATFKRGGVIQFMKPGLAASIASVETNQVDTDRGGWANGGVVDFGSTSGDDVCCAVVTTKEDVPAGHEASAVVDGDVYVLCFFEDNTGTSVAIPEFSALYLVEGEQYVTANASLTGKTIGRKCGIVLEDFTAGARTSGQAHLVRALFKGLPAYLS